MAHFIRQIANIFFVQLGDDDGFDPRPQGGDRLLLQPTDREDETAKGDFTRHGHLLADRSVAEQRGQRGKHGNPGGGTVFGHRPSRHMNVQVTFIKRLRIDAQSLRPIAHQAERSANRFFHDIAELAGEGEPALARVTNRFDMQHLSTRRRIGQSSNHPGRARLQLAFPDVHGRAQRLHHDCRRHIEPGDFGFGHPRRDMAGHRRNLTIQIPDARLPSVIFNHLLERLRRPPTLHVGQPMLDELPSDHVPLGNSQLFPLGVTRELHHLHAVTQRPGNRVKGVARGDENNLRKVERHVQIPVREFMVLTGI